MEETNKQPPKIIKRIVKNYELLEQSIINELSMENHSQHGTSTGSHREEVWANLLRKILPRKFAILKNGFVIDSSGNASPEIDIVIYDEQYVPYIFQYGETTKLVPIEAVFAVVQCKSTNVDKSILEKWVDAIDTLESNGDNAYAYTYSYSGNKGRKTRPIKILCSLRKKENKNAKSKFDIELFLDKDKEQLKVTSKWEGETYEKVVNSFNGEGSIRSHDDGNSEVYEKKIFEEIAKNKNAIITFSFLLNQMMMMINNPMFFSHEQYIKLFNDHEVSL